MHIHIRAPVPLLIITALTINPTGILASPLPISQIHDPPSSAGSLDPKALTGALGKPVTSSLGWQGIQYAASLHTLPSLELVRLDLSKRASSDNSGDPEDGDDHGEKPKNSDTKPGSSAGGPDDATLDLGTNLGTGKLQRGAGVGPSSSSSGSNAGSGPSKHSDLTTEELDKTVETEASRALADKNFASSKVVLRHLREPGETPQEGDEVEVPSRDKVGVTFQDLVDRGFAEGKSIVRVGIIVSHPERRVVVEGIDVERHTVGFHGNTVKEVVDIAVDGPKKFRGFKTL